MTAPFSFAETLAADGYALVRRHEPNALSLDALSKLGIIDAVEGLNEIQTLTPQGQTEAPPNTYSGNFGTSEFPLHTDLAHWAVPPRYLALRCEHGRPDVVTRLFDGQILVREFGNTALQMALVQPRRPMRNGRQLLRIVERIDVADFFRIRWDSLYLRPATGVASVIFDRVHSFLSMSEPREIALLERGDTLVIDNWRWLHGRSSTDAGSHSRRIARAYLRSLT